MIGLKMGDSHAAIFAQPENGFAIGKDSHPDNVADQDRVDSAHLYQTSTEQVIPLFFNRANGSSASAAG